MILGVVALAAMASSASLAGGPVLPGNMDAAGYRIVNLGAPVASADALRLEDVGLGCGLLKSSAPNSIACATDGTDYLSPTTGVPATRTVSATFPLSGGGALSSNITIGAASFPAYSILANATGSAAVPTALAAGGDGRSLFRSGGALVFRLIAEADVTNLTTDLAGKVPTTRTLTMSGALTCGGGGSCDLSADHTFALTIDPTLAVVSSALGRAAISGDGAIAAGSNTFALTNIPTGTTQAGTILQSGIAAPSSPASGKGSFYFDSTSLNLAVKNASGTVNHGMQTYSCSASQWARAGADTGLTTCSQPSYTDISGAPPAITSLTADVVATGPGAAAATIQPNVVTNAKAAQMVARSLKANPTNATANAQDLQSTAAGQVPLSTATSVAWTTLDQSTNGSTATWPTANTRFFAADTVNGSDANACYSDVDQATAGTLACKTLARLFQIVPKNGAERIARVAIRSGNYSTDTRLDLSGINGYRSFIITATDTVVSCGATAFANDANDQQCVGMATAAGMNAGGYNVTAYSVDGTGTASVTLRINGGGAPGFGAMPARPYGARIRFDVTTATSALRNKTYSIIYVSGGDTIIPGTAFAATPTISDVAYIESAAVTGPTETAIVGGSGGPTTIPLAIVGMVLGNVRVDRSSVRFVGTDTSAIVGIDSAVFAGSNLGTGSSNPGYGVKNSAMLLQGGLLAISDSTCTGVDGPQTLQGLSTIAWERSSAGSQIIVYEGARASGSNIVDTFGTNPSTAHGSTSQIWSPGGVTTQGVKLSGLAIFGGLTVNRIRFSNMGSNPAITVATKGNGVHLIAPTGGVADGNTGVGVDSSSDVVTINGAQGNDIAIYSAVLPTVTGSAGDIKLPDGTIVTWAQAAAGLLDSQGNRWMSPGTPYPIQQTTAGPLLTSLVGTGTRLVTASAAGQLGTSATSGFLPDPGSNGLVSRTAAGADVARTITSSDSSLTVANGNGVSGNPDLVLHQIPDATPALGAILFTARTQPATPAAGKADAFVDSASKALAVINDAGVVSHTVQTKTVVASNFLTGIAADGSVSATTVAFSGLTGSLSCSQLPAFTGDVTTSAGSCATAIAANVVANSMLAQMAANTIKGNNTAGTANAADLTATQVTAMLNAFTSTLKGLAPASGGGTANFLRADGTWAAPPSSGGTVTDVGATLPLTSTHGATPTIALNYDAATITLNGSNQIQVAALTGDVTKAAGSNATAIAANAVTNAKAAQMAALTIKGNNTGLTANAIDLTATQTTAMLDAFTSSLKGLVPASGGGTSNFMRADGTWAVPPSGGGGTITDVSATAPLTSTHGTTPTIALSANGVTDAFLRQGVASSVIGRSAASTGNVADIQCTADGNVVWRSGTTLGCSLLDYSKLTSTPTWPAATRLFVSTGPTTNPTSDAELVYATASHQLTAGRVVLINGVSDPGNAFFVGGATTDHNRSRAEFFVGGGSVTNGSDQYLWVSGGPTDITGITSGGVRATVRIDPVSYTRSSGFPSISEAAALYISAAPSLDPNIFASSYALRVASGATKFDGDLFLSTVPAGFLQSRAAGDGKVISTNSVGALTTELTFYLEIDSATLAAIRTSGTGWASTSSPTLINFSGIAYPTSGTTPSYGSVQVMTNFNTINNAGAIVFSLSKNFAIGGSTSIDVPVHQGDPSFHDSGQVTLSATTADNWGLVISTVSAPTISATFRATVKIRLSAYPF